MKPEQETPATMPHGNVAAIIADQERQLEVARRRVEDLTRENARMAARTIGLTAWKFAGCNHVVDPHDGGPCPVCAEITTLRDRLSTQEQAIQERGIRLARAERERDEALNCMREQVEKVQAVLDANARAAERIREEQNRTQALAAVLEMWHNLCTHGLPDCVPAWARPDVLEAWNRTKTLPLATYQGIDADKTPKQVPTEHTKNTEPSAEGAK